MQCPAITKNTNSHPRLSHVHPGITCQQKTPSLATCRAPEPTDVWWENLSVRGREAWQLRLQSAAVTIAVVAAGGVVQFYLAQAGEDERLRRLAYEV